jgi:hypothetical protein
MPKISLRCLLLRISQACTGSAFAFLALAADRQVVREQQTVTVEYATETWRLMWDGKPSSVCGPDEVFMAITCPCSGWAYGESGKLFLVRSRGGQEIERMDLRPLFREYEVAGTAYLQRWPLKLSDMHREANGDRSLIAEIKRRPAPEIMKLADYDRDGSQTEFLMQVGTLPCGKRQFAAIGVTKAVPHLHALTSVSHPDKPLIMPEHAWQALLRSPLPTVVHTWPCGDHGSERRSELVVSANKGAIHVKDREYSCPDNGAPEELLEETDE